MNDQRATFGAGCYWGTEKFIKEDFAKKREGLGFKLKGEVGFMGTTGREKVNPTYREVCSGATGHVEVFDCAFHGDDSIYEELCRFFFSFHDPTTENMQGNDVGSQYGSVIFYHTSAQKTLANRVKGELQAAIDQNKFSGVFSSRKISTLIVPAQTFYPATDDHQNYLAKNPGGYCNHYLRFSGWP